MQVRLATMADAPRISALIRVGEAAVRGYVTATNFDYRAAESDGQLAGVVALRANKHGISFQPMVLVDNGG